MADRKHYLIQDDDGVLTVFRAKSEIDIGHGHWHMDGTIPVDELPPALAIGLNMVEFAAKNGCNIINVLTWKNDYQGIFVHCATVEPPEKVGVEYLRTLPDGTRFENGATRFVIVDGGVYSYATRGRYHWFEMESWTWVKTACPENCPEWAPEQPNKGKE